MPRLCDGTPPSATIASLNEMLIAYARASRSFGRSPARPLPFPSIVVASTEDPRDSIEHARALASGWGSHFVDAGPLGHINAARGIGWWHDGQALLDRVLDAASDRHGTPRPVTEARSLLAVNATEAAQAHYLPAR